MRAAPAVSCANVHKNTHTSIQVQRRTPGFPCAVVYDLSRDLPGEPSSVATIARGKNSFRELDASFRAPEPHAFAVRIACARQSQASRPPHLNPRFVTTRDPPLSSGETGGVVKVICPTA